MRILRAAATLRSSLLERNADEARGRTAGNGVNGGCGTHPGRLDGELYQAKRFTTVRTQQVQAWYYLQEALFLDEEIQEVEDAALFEEMTELVVEDFRTKSNETCPGECGESQGRAPGSHLFTDLGLALQDFVTTCQGRGRSISCSP
jgi:hypothetical protein